MSDIRLADKIMHLNEDSNEVNGDKDETDCTIASPQEVT